MTDSSHTVHVTVTVDITGIMVSCPRASMFKPEARSLRPEAEVFAFSRKLISCMASLPVAWVSPRIKDNSSLRACPQLSRGRRRCRAPCGGGGARAGDRRTARDWPPARESGRRRRGRRRRRIRKQLELEARARGACRQQRIKKDNRILGRFNPPNDISHIGRYRYTSWTAVPHPYGHGIFLSLKVE